MNTEYSQNVPAWQQPGHELAVLSLFGQSVVSNHSPYVSLVNAPLNDPQGKKTSIHEVLWRHARRTQKIDNNLRSLLFKLIDTQKSHYAPIEIPFITSNQGSSAVEVYWGTRRYIAYLDPNVAEYCVFKEIPVVADDPENYISTVRR